MEKLYANWLETKQQIDKMKSSLLEIEKQIYIANEERINAKGLGTVSFNEGPFKVKITTKESISWDQEALRSIEATLPFETQYKVSKKDLDYIAKVDPDLYRRVIDCSTTKNAKPSFKVELNEEI